MRNRKTGNKLFMLLTAHFRKYLSENIPSPLLNSELMKLFRLIWDGRLIQSYIIIHSPLHTDSWIITTDSAMKVSNAVMQ